MAELVTRSPGLATGELPARLRELEAAAIARLRSVAQESTRTALLFSGSHRSIVTLRLAEKAFAGAAFPFTLLAVETRRTFPEVTFFRNRRAAEVRARFVVHRIGLEENTARGIADAVTACGFDAAIDGELDRGDGTLQTRVLPLLGAWTELDVWQYIKEERLAVPSLYLAHRRAVVWRGDALVPVTAATPPAPGEKIEEMSVRFRGAADVGRAAAVASTADTIDAVIAETAARSTSASCVP